MDVRYAVEDAVMCCRLGHHLISTRFVNLYLKDASYQRTRRRPQKVQTDGRASFLAGSTLEPHRYGEKGCKRSKKVNMNRMLTSVHLPDLFGRKADGIPARVHQNPMASYAWPQVLSECPQSWPASRAISSPRALLWTLSPCLELVIMNQSPELLLREELQDRLASSELGEGVSKLRQAHSPIRSSVPARSAWFTAKVSSYPARESSVHARMRGSASSHHRCRGSP